METGSIESTKSTIAQKEAVYTFVVEALGGRQPAEGANLKSLVTKDVRKAVRAKLFEGFKSGTIGLKRQMSDSDLKKYCSSLITNWFKKDGKFN